MTGMLLAAPESCQKWNSNSLILDIWIELSSQNGGWLRWVMGGGRGRWLLLWQVAWSSCCCLPPGAITVGGSCEGWYRVLSNCSQPLSRDQERNCRPVSYNCSRRLILCVITVVTTLGSWDGWCSALTAAACWEGNLALCCYWGAVRSDIKLF